MDCSVLCINCSKFYASIDQYCSQCSYLKKNNIDDISSLSFSINVCNAIENTPTSTEYIKFNFAKLFRLYLKRIWIKGIILTRTHIFSDINSFLKKTPGELIGYLSGLADGTRKGITAIVADELLYHFNLFINSSQIYKYVDAIGPFIIDPWNCKIDGLFYAFYFDLSTLENPTVEKIFNIWNMSTELQQFDNCIVSKCRSCSANMLLKDRQLKCLKCEYSFHLNCFHSLNHICKSYHYELAFQLLAEQIGTI